MLKVSIPLIHKRNEIKFLFQANHYEFTHSGISRYQKENGLPITGVVDMITYQKLKSGLMA